MIPSRRITEPISDIVSKMSQCEMLETLVLLKIKHIALECFGYRIPKYDQELTTECVLTLCDSIWKTEDETLHEGMSISLEAIMDEVKDHVNSVIKMN